MAAMRTIITSTTKQIATTTVTSNMIAVGKVYKTVIIIHIKTKPVTKGILQEGWYDYFGLLFYDGTLARTILPPHSGKYVFISCLYTRAQTILMFAVARVTLIVMDCFTAIFHGLLNV